MHLQHKLPEEIDGWLLRQYTERLLDDGRVAVRVLYGTIRGHVIEVEFNAIMAVLERYPLTIAAKVIDRVQRKIAEADAKACEPTPRRNDNARTDES